VTVPVSLVIPMRSVSGARNLILSQIKNRSLVIAFLGMTNENPRPTSH